MKALTIARSEIHHKNIVKTVGLFFCVYDVRATVCESTRDNRHDYVLTTWIHKIPKANFTLLNYWTWHWVVVNQKTVIQYLRYDPLLMSLCTPNIILSLQVSTHTQPSSDNIIHIRMVEMRYFHICTVINQIFSYVKYWVNKWKLGQFVRIVGLFVCCLTALNRGKFTNTTNTNYYN